MQTVVVLMLNGSMSGGGTCEAEDLGPGETKLLVQQHDIVEAQQSQVWWCLDNTGKRMRGLGT